MLSEASIFGFAAGLMLGGSIRNLIRATFRGLPLLFLAAGIDFAMSTSLGVMIASTGTWALMGATILQSAFLLVFVLMNIKRAPLWLIAAGGLMNSAAILANSGRMPISPQIFDLAPGSPYTQSLLSGKIANYVLAGPDTKLLLFSDIIPFRGITLYMISAGDMVTSAGLIILIISLMTSKDKA